MPPVSGVRSTVDGGAEQPRLHDDGHEGVGIEIALQRQRGRNRRWRLHDWLRKQLRAQKVFLLDGLVDAEAVEDGFVGSAGQPVALGREWAFFLEPLFRDRDGGFHRGGKCAQSILSSHVALALGDGDSGLVGGVPLAHALGDADIIARFAGVVPQLEAVTHLDLVLAFLLLLVLHT
eukprot:CAMPEP_0174701408 /NCGR_PEP_ID=MMETSP1094-20130205/6050_1 /TAXON_ID=156173 /ORGANISM="Chrysochromulina brevifilum, Strain UTEX LB 985" /LENGTH=176 /DNA_ID=CAMNT_0015899045 /DNA_START=231 /DNA_END=761 /DNA_ORIENTATION=+